jgi:hypothetical protein
MNETLKFLPKRTSGIILHAFMLILILSGIGVLLWLAFRQTSGGALVLYLIGSLLLLSLLPIAGYRGYALIQAAYYLGRDGLHIRWGLRSEDVPLSEVEWIRPAADLQIPLKLPLFSTIGAILGSSTHPDLGKVEFIASSVENLVIVASMNKIICISPDDIDDFVHRAQRILEMGSLTSIEPVSSVPAAFINRVFNDHFARVIVPAGFALTLLLFLVAALFIQGKASLSIGYDSSGNLVEPVAASQLLLLPFLSAFLYLLSLVGGTYFFRKSESRSVSYVLWMGGLVTPFLLFIATVLFLVS